ncbi:GntR family transcriptional regulator [Frondihabitans sp. PAMC 28766]|uniref:GntR family transcriptional regulator n=1 Tax=Frondihabitans sp. PAMC 28766 TaxID=1795630 RepID=UPI00078BE666|nr:GntR family transcriptional regulator [Frondihabitans sp. PAMC 28766]AMM20035.1 GntR family transcriptional regulator [Frondihabitans sp. PAMC 28766]
MTAQIAGELPPDLFFDLDRTGPIPLYFQVAQRIEEAIATGTIPAGARLENEVALGERLGLSRPTIRRALQELVDKGLLVRRRGIGTQVVHGPVNRNVELTSLFDDLASGGQRPSTRVLEQRIVPADESVAEDLGLAVGEEVTRLRRLRLADDVPIGLLENYLPTTVADLEGQDLAATGLYQILRAQGVVMRVAKQRIGARAARDDEASLLEIDENGAVLTMSRTAYDASGRAVEVGHHIYRPDRYSFSITLVEK